MTGSVSQHAEGVRAVSRPNRPLGRSKAREEWEANKAEITPRLISAATHCHQSTSEMLQTNFAWLYSSDCQTVVIDFDLSQRTSAQTGSACACVCVCVYVCVV